MIYKNKIIKNIFFIMNLMIIYKNIIYIFYIFIKKFKIIKNYSFD